MKKSFTTRYFEMLLGIIFVAGTWSHYLEPLAPSWVGPVALASTLLLLLSAAVVRWRDAKRGERRRARELEQQFWLGTLPPASPKSPSNSESHHRPPT